MRPRKPIRFYENYRGCWICCSHRTKNGHGYSMIKREGQNIRLHRYMWEKYRGQIPRGMCVLHTCDNRACNNPEHLFLGTQVDNMRDRDNKNRQARGIDHGHAVLTEQQVKEIYFTRGTQKAMAKMYGVNQAAIGKIKRGETWKHLYQ